MSQNKSFVKSCKNSTCSANIDSQKQICIHVKYHDEHNNKSYTGYGPCLRTPLYKCLHKSMLFIIIIITCGLPKEDYKGWWLSSCRSSVGVLV